MKVKNSLFKVVAIVSVLLSVVLVSGCVDHSGDKILCGKIQYMTDASEWTRHGVLCIDNQYYSILVMKGSSFQLLKFAYTNSCTVSVLLTHWTDGDWTIEENGVSLLDCGCKK